MSARTGINVDIIQTKSLYFRNLADNAAISTKYVLYADGSGGTFWSSLYIENIPGFSSFYNSTVGLCSTISYNATEGLSTYYESTVNAYGNSLSTFSTTFNCTYMPLGVYSTIRGLGTIGYVSSQTLGAALQSTIIGANLVSSLSSCQFESLAIKVVSNGFEYTSSGTRMAFFTSSGSLALGKTLMPSSGITLDVNGMTSFRSNIYVYPGGLSVGKPVGNSVNGEVDVSGNIFATNIFIAGQGIFSGSVIASQYLTSSDSNLKKDIETYSIGNNVWSSIRGVRFNWRSNDREDIGFIAQELQELIPESVSATNNGRLVIDPTKLIPLLVETVKELKAKVSEMDARLKRLEN